jgi:glutathione-specific gamma-glutamylcyclotransferase
MRCRREGVGITKRQMALTLDLVARVQRVLEDPGPEPGLYQTDEDYDSAVREILVTHARGEDAWLFAYGSLIWKPEVEHVEECKGTARGWHRSFCFKVTRFRGTRERPGLMMALDRGGQCGGILYRLPGDTLKAQLGKLFRREFTVKPANTIPRWITAETVQGSVRAITFVMNRKARAYVGRLAPGDTADILATACGHWGAGAEYLYNTISRLEARGIHDRNLWRLQELVAAKIPSDHVPEAKTA